MEDEHTKEPSHNNPEEATDYVKAVNLLLQSFVNDIRGFNRYKCQDAYKTFLYTLSQLLSKLDSTYFTNMDTEVVLHTIPDKVCAAFLARPEEAANKVQQCVSSDSIPTGPEVTSKMCLQGNIPCFDQKGQQAITKLFGHLQDTHNHMSQVAKAVVDVSEVSSPEQFTFVLQLAVRPIIQLKIPPHLSAPTELKFEKERLTPEEITEENCCNLILPQPFHPKFSTIAFKHPTRCLAAAAHFLIRKKLFNTKYPQLLVAKDFAVAEKKLHLTVSGRKYDPGKKAPKKRHTSDVKQQIPNHQLHKISHKTNLSLNSSHKMSPSLNSHKACPPVNNNHKAKHPLVFNRNWFHLNLAMTMKHFQMHGPWPEKLLPQKIPDLYQRNQDTVYDRKQITFNPFCLIFSLQIKRKTSYILENSRIVTKCQVHQNFF